MTQPQPDRAPIAPPSRDSEAAQILESITDAFFALDREWRFTYLNSQAERVLARPREELLGRNVWAEFPAAVGTRFEREYRRALAEGVTVSFEEHYPSPLDTWFQVRAYPAPEGLSVFFQDVNDRKRGEEVLRQSEERYRLLVEGAKDYAMILLDAEGRVTGWNAGAERILGWTEAETLGRSGDLIFTPEDREQGVPAEEMQKAAAQGKATELRWHVRKDDSRFYSDGVMEVLCDDAGEVRGFAKVLRDATETRRAQEALSASEARIRDAQARLAASLAAGGIATWAWDLVNDRIVADAACARLFSVSPEEADGGPGEAYLRAVHPDDRDRVTRAIGAAVDREDAYEAEYRVTLPGGQTRWLVSRGRVERDAAGRAVTLPGVTVDITEQAERRSRERLLAELAERARRLTDPDEVIADAVRSLGEFLGVSRCIFADIDIEADTCTIHPDYRADPSVASIEGVVPISAFGPFVVTEYAARRAVAVDDVRLDPVRVPPETVPAYEAIGILSHVTVPVAHSDRVVSCVSVHNAEPRRWGPEDVELLRGVAERTWLTVEVIRQQRALTREVQVTARILESITDAFFTLDHQWRFTHVNRETERILFRTHEELLGRYIWAVFPEGAGSTFDRQYRRAVAEGVSVSFEEFYPPLEAWLEVRAYPSPDGLSVFFQDVTARKRAEQEREQLLAEQRALAEREALINRIGHALLTATDAAVTEGRAVGLLGAALGADRCYLVSWDSGRDQAVIFQDHRRAGLSGLEDEYVASLYAPAMDVLFAGGTAVVVDALSPDVPGVVAAVTAKFGLRSVLAVPFFDASGRLTAATWVAMVDGPRAWTPAEVSLVETAAALTHTALEAARVAERERRIAEELQAALTPSIPERVPGLALAKYYEAALAEAGVGGDFYDVFTLDKGCTALVVGDLAGKGLAAATQVATVRNMLRYAVYRARSLAGALEGLNALLAEQGLLTGFATLFLGAYDSGAGTLTYVNCGQEPALLRRAGTGRVETLSATGPVLGSFEGAMFEERTITLGAGDALAVFTDGLTEVGRSRLEMLGAEGVTALLEGASVPAEAEGAEAVAEHLAVRLIEGVDGFADGGVMRDDMCLLVAVAE